MTDRDWSAAANAIAAGWRVRRYSNLGGEIVGRVVSAAELSAEAVLRVPVGWELGSKFIEETLSEPSWRRSLRRSEGAVVISSTDSLTVFEPAADNG